MEDRGISRRNFLARLAGVAAAVVVAPATMLVEVQRLGEPQEWVATPLGVVNTYYCVRSGYWDDPGIWRDRRRPPPILTADEAIVISPDVDLLMHYYKESCPPPPAFPTYPNSSPNLTRSIEGSIVSKIDRWGI